MITHTAAARVAALALAAALSGAAAGCATSASPAPIAPAAPTHAPTDSTNGMGGMSGMTDLPMASGHGLAETVNGYTLELRTPPTTTDTRPTFAITHSGAPVTRFVPEQTKLMHLYLIRSDLTGFQHVHPSMAPDGTWSAPTTPLAPGDYRMYVQFVPGDQAGGETRTLSTPLTVPGPDRTARTPLPPPSPSTSVDGYTLALSGQPRAGTETPLTITISRAGRPVTDLQPYLDTYAHVTAIHQGDLAFAHLHPDGALNGDHGGPILTVHAALPARGAYRMFIQFQTDNTLHTAPITLTAS